jgi:hypothetical protein
MRVGIVGSREFMDAALVERAVRRLLARDPDVVIVSGGARGADAIAEMIARRLCAYPPVIFPADWRRGRGAGLARNQKIVDASDEVVAFWDGKSTGTMDTVRKALTAKKPTFVYSALAGRWLSDPEVRLAAFGEGR